MLFGSVSEETRAIIASGAEINRAEVWREIMDEARRWRPAGYDAAQETLRHHYEGDFIGLLQVEVARRFPNTGHRMALAPYNWAKLYAQNSAAVFDLPPRFSLMRDGREINASDPQITADDAGRVAAFGAMLDEAMLQVTLADAERRMKLARDCFIRVHSDSLEAAATGMPPKTVASAFWPADVHVIPHPSAPANLATAAAIIARVSSDDGAASSDVRKYEFWRRPFKLVQRDGGGMVTEYGPWSCEHVTERLRKTNSGAVVSDVSFETIWERYPHRRAPWVVMRDGIASGSPYTDGDRQLTTLFTSINASIMSHWFAVDMGAASVLVRQTNETPRKKVALGPGLMVDVPKDDVIQSIVQSVDFAGIGDANRQALAMLAITSRQRVGSYDIEASAAPKSGVALKIEEGPAYKARVEGIALVRPAVIDLLGIMAEVHSEARGVTITGDGVSVGWSPAARLEHEDPGAPVDRAVRLHQEGLLSGEDALLHAQVAHTSEQAAEAFARARAERAAARPSAMLAALDGADEEAPAATEQPQDDQVEMTVNELTLDIERLKRAGDAALVAKLKARLASLLAGG